MSTPEKDLALYLDQLPGLVGGENLFAEPPDLNYRTNHGVVEPWQVCVNVFRTGGVYTKTFDDKYHRGESRVGLQITVRTKDPSFAYGTKLVSKIEHKLSEMGSFRSLSDLTLFGRPTYLGKTQDDHHSWSMNIRAADCRPELAHYYYEESDPISPTPSLDGVDNIVTGSIFDTITLTMTGGSFVLAVPDRYADEFNVYSGGSELSKTIIAEAYDVDCEPYSIIKYGDTFTGLTSFEAY